MVGVDGAMWILDSVVGCRWRIWVEIVKVEERKSSEKNGAVYVVYVDLKGLLGDHSKYFLVLFSRADL